MALGVMNLVLAGMMVYLRFGPFQRVLDRMAEQGTEVPAWLPNGFSLGVLVMGGFLVFRGVSSIRQGLRSDS